MPFAAYKSNKKSPFATETIVHTVNDIDTTNIHVQALASVAQKRRSIILGDSGEKIKDTTIRETSMKKKRLMKTMSFAERLMEVLSNDHISDIMTWLPDGKTFAIIQPAKLVSDILPQFFQEAKLCSFDRKLRRWGFKRAVRGSKTMIFYHELFLRDRPELCRLMQSKYMEAIKGKKELSAHKNNDCREKFEPKKIREGTTSSQNLLTKNLSFHSARNEKIHPSLPLTCNQQDEQLPMNLSNISDEVCKKILQERSFALRQSPQFIQRKSPSNEIFSSLESNNLQNPLLKGYERLSADTLPPNLLSNAEVQSYMNEKMSKIYALYGFGSQWNNNLSSNVIFTDFPVVSASCNRSYDTLLSSRSYPARSKNSSSFYATSLPITNCRNILARPA